MHCRDAASRGDRDRSALNWRFLWLVALVFCLTTVYGGDVEVRVSAEVRVALSAGLPEVRKSGRSSGDGAVSNESTFPGEATATAVASVHPNVWGRRGGEAHLRSANGRLFGTPWLKAADCG